MPKMKFIDSPYAVLGVGLIVLSACATKLKSEADLAKPPDEFSQKIEAVPGAVLPVAETSGGLSAPMGAADSLKKILSRAKGLEPPKVEAKKLKSKKTAPKKTEMETAALKTWQPVSWPFGIGEKITLVMRYGVLEGGVATLEVLDQQMVNGEPVLHYQGHVKSSKILDFFYKIDDTIDSWVGLNDHLPRRQEIKQLESARWGRRVVVFDTKKQTARFFGHADFKNGNQEDVNREDPMATFAQDVFGALYFYRFIALGETGVNFSIHDRFRNWSNELTYLGRETIKVPLGEFKALHYKMFPRVTGDLAPKGDVEIWVSDDPKRLMLQFQAKIKVGSITGELKEYVEGRPIALATPVMKTTISLPPETATK